MPPTGGAIDIADWAWKLAAGSSVGVGAQPQLWGIKTTRFCWDRGRDGLHGWVGVGWGRVHSETLIKIW